MKTFSGICFLLLATTLCLYSQPLPGAHAHNDYEHERPLFDALHFGFTSVEADVFLVRGRLLVSHTYPVFSSKTLESLYFRPLDSLLQLNHGKIYPGYEWPFFLMIDLKSDGEETYPVLRESLSRFTNLSHSANAIIFLSGNRPKDSWLKDKTGMLPLDGRPEDLGKGYSRESMPIVSDNYNKWSDWNGKGIPTSEEMSRIADLARRVHAEGKKLRLWAIPDNTNAWRELLKAGVDVINTDHLGELNLFFRAK